MVVLCRKRREEGGLYSLLEHLREVTGDERRGRATGDQRHGRGHGWVLGVRAIVMSGFAQEEVVKHSGAGHSFCGTVTVVVDDHDGDMARGC